MTPDLARSLRPAYGGMVEVLPLPDLRRLVVVRASRCDGRRGVPLLNAFKAVQDVKRP